jgi:hypothetical protein
MAESAAAKTDAWIAEAKAAVEAERKAAARERVRQGLTLVHFSALNLSRSCH